MKGVVPAEEKSQAANQDPPAAHVLKTVADVLAVLAESRRAGCPLPMIRTAAGYACQFLGLTPEECPIEKFRELGKPFKEYLKERRFSGPPPSLI
jgi:hypothetical protein